MTTKMLVIVIMYFPNNLPDPKEPMVEKVTEILPLLLRFSSKNNTIVCNFPTAVIVLLVFGNYYCDLPIFGWLII